MHLPHAFEAISLSLTSTASLRLQRFRFPHTTARNPHTTPPTTSYCSPTHLSTTSNCAAASHSFITRLSIAGECRLFSSAPSANIIITDRSFAYASFTCERRNRHRRRATHQSPLKGEAVAAALQEILRSHSQSGISPPPTWTSAAAHGRAFQSKCLSFTLLEPLLFLSP